MAGKKYRLESKCPQCGCSFVDHLTDEEIEKRYGGLDNAHMTCGECAAQYEARLDDACPEWAKDCKGK